MFIREVVKKNKGYDKTFIYHQLVESYRSEKGPRQRRLLELGKLTIVKSKWKTLANRIEEIITGQISHLETDREIEPLAQHYASLLIHKQLDQQKELGEEPSPEYEEIDLNSLQVRHVRSIGGEHVALCMLRRIGLQTILKRLGLTEDAVKIAELLIVSRMIHPASEWETLRWVKHNSGICEYLELPLSALSHSKLYRISDKLLAHKEAIESSLAEKERSLFSLQEKLVLYDLTNSYFESSQESSLKKRGRSKDKRHDRPLVTLGLVLDEDGFPKQSHIFEGNVSEPQTFAKILAQIGKDKSRILIIDAGIASEGNIRLIRQYGHDYIVVSRSRPDVEIEEGEFVEIRHDQRNRVQAYLYEAEEELYLYCRSQLKKKKEDSIRSFHQARLEADLKYACESLHKKRGTKRYAKVVERIGRLKQKHAKVAYFYDIHIKENDGIVTEISWKLKNEQKIDERFAGSYYLRTNRKDLTEAKIWNLYISLTDIEDSFRSMKSELGLQPNYHQKDNRIKAHIFITVLAHHIVNAMQKYLHKEDIYLRWSTIREMLSSQQRLTTEMKNRKGEWIRIRQTSEPEAFHYLVSHALKIKPKPLGIKRHKI